MCSRSHFSLCLIFLPLGLKCGNINIGYLVILTRKQKSNSIPKTPRKTYVHTKTCILKFITALLTIPKKQKPKCQSTAQQMCYIHKMKYYLAIKRNKVLMHRRIRMNLENILLRERSQAQKTFYDSIFMKDPKQANIKKQNRLVYAQGWGVWGGDDC